MYQKIKVKSRFCNKNTKLLFDYATDEYYKSYATVSKKSYLALEDQELKIKNSPFSENILFIDDTKYNLGLVDYSTNKQNYVVNFSNKMMNEIKSWIVIKSTFTKDNGYKLKEGDVIKFGKVSFKIKIIKVYSEILKYVELPIIKKKNEESTFISKNLMNMNNTLNLNGNKSKTNLCCRICLNDEFDQTNPLIRPCKCSGTMKYVHLVCIKAWIKSQTDLKTSQKIKIYKIKKFECEICKTEFPDKIKINNEILDIVEIDYPVNSTYLILENIKSEFTEKKYIYLIDFKNSSTLSIGRSNSCDIILSDTTVSKLHSQLSIIYDSIYLEDFFSKFGSLVQLRCPLQLILNKKITIQFKNFNITFKSVRSFKARICCYCFKEKMQNYNEILNENLIDKDYIITYDFNEISLISDSKEHIKKDSSIFLENEENNNKNICNKESQNFNNKQTENNDLMKLKLKRNSDFYKIFEPMISSRLIKLKTLNISKNNELKLNSCDLTEKVNNKPEQSFHEQAINSSKRNINIESQSEKILY